MRPTRVNSSAAMPPNTLAVHASRPAVGPKTDPGQDRADERRPEHAADAEPVRAVALHRADRRHRGVRHDPPQQGHHHAGAREPEARAGGGGDRLALDREDRAQQDEGQRDRDQRVGVVEVEGVDEAGERDQPVTAMTATAIESASREVSGSRAAGLRRRSRRQARFAACGAGPLRGVAARRGSRRFACRFATGLP